MTRKHFEMIAKEIANMRRFAEDNDLSAKAALGFLAANLAATLQITNPNFDANRFIEACKK